MRKFTVPVVAALASFGATTWLARAAPVAVRPTVGLEAAAGDIANVKFFRCAVGRHRGPLGYCRPNTARPLFIFRRPCAPGRHRNFFGRCVFNR